MIRGKTGKTRAWPVRNIRPAAARIMAPAAVIVAAGMAAAMAAAPALAAPHAPASGTNPGPDWTQIGPGGSHTCGIRAGGSLWCWGANGSGQLGIGNLTDQDRPRQVTTPDKFGWASITAGSSHTCATRSNTTLWCWGDGQDRPQEITRPAGGGWASVTAGYEQTCAIRSNRTLWCWGGGQTPQQITSPDKGGWASVAPGDGFTCATRAGGTVWCWGLNVTGQLGIGTTANENLPTQVTSPAKGGWASVSTGESHACATRTNGTLWCWGWGDYGQLGIGDIDFETLPVQEVTPARGGWASVTTGYAHTCATRVNRALWCWGYNTDGELGLGFYSQGLGGEKGYPYPDQVTAPATGWLTVKAGESHTCGIRTGGSLWCTGDNSNGQLGAGSGPTQDLFQQVTWVGRA
jgi:alpha-tubulin suppressor-like RCC1 family protein